MVRVSVADGAIVLSLLTLIYYIVDKCPTSCVRQKLVRVTAVIKDQDSIPLLLRHLITGRSAHDIYTISRLFCGVGLNPFIMRGHHLGGRLRALPPLPVDGQGDF